MVDTSTVKLAPVTNTALSGYIPDSFYIKTIILPNGTVVDGGYMQNGLSGNSMVKQMFIMLPKLCFKFNAILSQQPDGNYREYVYKNHGVSSADFDMSKINGV